MSEARVSAALKRAVADRAQGCCEYCRSQARLATHPFSIEHIIPKTRGGEAAVNNLALACQGCNNHKYDKIAARDPASGQAVPLYHPRRDRWRDHFVWSAEFQLIVGRTPVGRATVEALQLNRSGVVNLRRVLYSMGEHPPADPEG
jgi:hypothetical protein